MAKAPESGLTYTPTSREKQWVDAFVPKRFASATLGTFTTNQHNLQLFIAAKEWAKTGGGDSGQGLILCGTVGTGKTHLLFAIGRELASRGEWAIYKNFARLCIAMKDAWRSREPSTHLKELVRDADILLLDDLGSEMREMSDQGWITELVYEIVEHRYNEMLPMVVATNLSMADLAERYTERVASRLAEMAVPLWVDGYDYRLRGRVG